MLNIFLLFFFLSTIKSIKSIQEKDICVWLTGASYCGKEKYPTMILGGPSSTFNYEYTIYDVKTDLEGFIGTLNTTQSIYIVLRGTNSILNWVDDLEVKLVPYNTYEECQCRVHYGFYNSVLRIIDSVMENIQRLINAYPTYQIIITGHSYAAATGQLLAMELSKKNIITSLYNFGQPRVGDEKYASFVNTKLKNYYRFTHDKDIVPHLPPLSMGYQHSCGEIFENSQGELRECSKINCEDENCAVQYLLAETNVNDHSYYLGHYLSCENSII